MYVKVELVNMEKPQKKMGS